MKSFFLFVCVVVGFSMVYGRRMLGHGEPTGNKSVSSNSTKHDQYAPVPTKHVQNLLRGSNMYRDGPSKDNEKPTPRQMTEL